MQWCKFLLATLAVVAAVSAQAEDDLDPTICEDPSCKCDAHSRVICNCRNYYDEVMVRPSGNYRVLPTTTAIIINNCSRVIIYPHAINGSHLLKDIEITNVNHLDLKENSLHWSPYPRDKELTNPGLRIDIKNTTIGVIRPHAIKGRVDSISIIHSKLSSIRPYAFSSLSGVNIIQLKHNHYTSIDLHAFKKFSMINFEMIGGHAYLLPSRFLSDVEVLQQFRMEGVRIGTIHSNAFMVYGPNRVTIINNKIDLICGESFKIAARGIVDFRNNTLAYLEDGAFQALTVETPTLRQYGPQELVIDNNTVSVVTLKSFDYNTSYFKLKFDGLHINQPCECEMANNWISIISNTGGSISCNNTLENHYVYLPTYIDTSCKNINSLLWPVLTIVCIIAISLGSTITAVIMWRENEKKKRMKVVMPDGRTYRETELHVIVENADLLTTDL